MSDIHVVPLNDLIEHEDDDRVCGPTVEHVPGVEGDGWVTVHNSLDGRERKEKR